jgi:septal ring factor EnvC (AmiA/AmiB activator)
MRARAVVATIAAVALSAMVRADDRAAHLDDPRVTVTNVGDGLAAIDKEERAARAEIEVIGPKEQQTRRRLISRGRMLYRMVRVGLLPAGGGIQSILDHAAKMERARRGLEQDLTDWQSLADRRVGLGRKLDNLAARRAPLELARASAEETRAAIDEADDRRRAFERAFQTSTGAGDYVAVYGAGLGPEGPGASTADGFRGMKGRLPFPIAGRAEIRNVRRQGALGPGLEMYAPLGSPVRSVFPGRVAFADHYESFGKVVILDHGDHFYTLMGNLGSIDVRVGDDVSAGAKVGTVGASSSQGIRKDGARESLLYFEVRHGEATLDATTWLGL